MKANICTEVIQQTNVCTMAWVHHAKNQSKLMLLPKTFNIFSQSHFQNQKNVLIKDIKYTPTPKQSIIALKQDVVKFTNKPKIIEIFSSEEQVSKSD